MLNFAFRRSVRTEFFRQGQTVRRFDSQSNGVWAPSKPRVVILGSGWAGNRLARELDKSIFDVRVVSPANHFLFTPLLPQTTVGTLEFRTVQEPIRTIENLSGYYQAKARTLDVVKRTVKCEEIFSKESFTLPFDFLVVATGCKTNTFNTPGIMENEGKDVFFLKHLHHARQIRKRVLECFERAAIPGMSESEIKRLLHFVVVGGGPTSCEFVAELHDFVVQDISRWYPDIADYVRITLVEAGPRILGNFDQGLVDYAFRNFKERKIDVRTSVGVVEVKCAREHVDSVTGRRHQHSDAVLSDGSEVPFGMMVWSAGLANVKFVQGIDIFNKGPTGRILTDRFLRVSLNSDSIASIDPNHRIEDRRFSSQGLGMGGRIYALGDCAVNEEAPLAPLAAVAEQQADYLAHVLNGEYGPMHARGELEDATDLDIPRLPVPVASFPPFPSSLYKASRSFRYIARGSMSSMGSFRGIVDLSHVDTPLGKMPDHVTASGLFGFLAWNGYYFSKQYSLSNMILNPLMKLKAMCFGRDISRF